MKIKKENPANHYSYEYHFFFFFHYLNDSQAISKLHQGKDSIWPDCALLIYAEYHLLTLTSHADFRRTTHRSKSYFAYGVLNFYPRSIMFLEETVNLHFFSLL